MTKAEVIWSGRSQVVLLPEGIRFDTNDVRIRRHGCSVVLEPIAQDWAWLDKIVGPVDEDFERAAIGGDHPWPARRRHLS